MSAKVISKQQFDRKSPIRNEMVRQLADERAWFEDSDAKLIGTVFCDRSDNDFNYVILGPDEIGQYRCVHANSCFQTAGDATMEMLSEMTKISMDHQQIYPQGD